MLEAGWSIAAGVVEGACRQLIADRFGRPGRGAVGLAGAEAVLKLRVLVANGHLEEYWSFISPGSTSLSIRAATRMDMPLRLDRFSC
ncbi:hypothetical protein [Nonomuraea sp. NPDC049758]|uniref:hypothetical protein n=1 Tax=Nonomuraea sp. NPDC049758 TaxID=3154360 RepID=UPI0034488E37